MKLTDKQKAGVRKAVAEHLAYYATDDYGEPLKDVEQNKSWPSLPDSASDEDRDALDDACFEYLTAAIKAVAKHLKAQP